MPDLSVAICTYNGELRLPALLSCLQQQQSDCQWEVIVVDNNSSDRTAELIRRYQSIAALWRRDVPLRYYFEPRQGSAYARRCAVKHITSPLIGFIDDDNLPEPDWVEAAFQFGQQHPQAGAYGSNIYGQYEITPPPGFNRIACCLAIINRGDRPFQYSTKRGVLPAGAGMVVRRQAWLQQVPNVPRLAGVCAGSLKSKGEDVEALSHIRQAWPIWHNPAMKLAHVMPKERLSRQYLQHLFWRVGLSRYLLRRGDYSTWQWPFMVPLYFVSDSKKLLIKLLKTRHLGTVERCEFSLLIGALVSPFGQAWERWFGSKETTEWTTETYSATQPSIKSLAQKR